MKKLFLFAVGVLMTFSCVTSNRMLEVKDKNLIDIKQDKEEYELLVIDPGFDNWFITTWSPAKDRNVAYYKQWNQRYVISWNQKASSPHTYNLFDSTIQYEPATDYGMEVERKLFYYFRWVETVKKIPILDSPPPAGVL